MSTGEWVQEARKAKKLSEAELGELVGVSQVRVSQWETARATPSPEETRRLMEVPGSPGNHSPESGVRSREAAATAPSTSDSGLNDPTNAEAHLDRMVGLLRADGVRFPNNRVMVFDRLEACCGSEVLHAEGEWRAQGDAEGQSRAVAVSFGPQFGPVTAYPVENTTLPKGASKVAAWFLDTDYDYDSRTFCITQAFFPDKTAWQKLARSLKGVVDDAAFDALSGTTSLPFSAGKHKRAAVKVIDPRGNEAMRVHRLGGPSYE